MNSDPLIIGVHYDVAYERHDTNWSSVASTGTVLASVSATITRTCSPVDGEFDPGGGGAPP